MPQLSLIQQICIWVLPLLFAITFHEAAHAYAAFRCGDTTAKMFGRLSLNPIRHVDPIGTLLIPLMIGVLTKFTFLFGYAKPVPINWGQLKNPRRDMMLVALAGPLANVIMALFWACCFKIATMLQLSKPVQFLLLTAQAGIVINLVLFILNLIPIPPLDGSRVVSSLLPWKMAQAYSKIEPYGFYILIVLLLTGVIGSMLSPLIDACLQLIKFIFKL
ncbi:MAG: site-2 protease family protein [Legionella sp.]|nr:site-2 protease family protein [Legionella sp.]